MPLSEEEQRILQDIERNFYENDPEFARAVTGEAAVYRHAGRNCRLALAGFIFGLVVLITSFTRMPIIGFLGFVAMVIAVVVFVHNLRRLGAVRLRDVADSQRARQVGETVDDFRSRLKNKFRRQ